LKGRLFGPPVAIPFTVDTLGEQRPHPQLVMRVILKEAPAKQRITILFSAKDWQQ
jgi:hypothetical protein